MKPRDYIISQIKHKETKPVPFTMPCEAPVAKRLDEYYGGSRWKSMIPKDTLQEKKISQSHMVDGYGGIWRIDRLPWHLEKPPLSGSTLKGYKFPSVSQFVDPIYENKGAAIEKINNDKESFHSIAMGWGIFEQTWRIRGFEEVLMDMIEEPEFYREFTERITELYVEMVKACSDIPADAFLFGDDWGEQRGVIIGPDRWREFIKPCWKKVYAEVHKQGKFAMSHSCGSVADIMPDIIEIGLDVLESVQPEAEGMNTYVLKEKWGDKIAFWGTLGSQSLLPFGTPAEIRNEVKKLCEIVGKGGGLILAPAKPLRPEMPTENVVALLEALANQ
jgi:uroporphyrinogen decarboxylase